MFSLVYWSASRAIDFGQFGILHLQLAQQSLQHPPEMLVWLCRQGQNQIGNFLF